MTDELKVGSDFWALAINGHYGPGGDPFDFTIVGETKTLWRIRRTGIPTHTPFTIKKDMSEWHVIAAKDAEVIRWMRNNSQKVSKAVNRLIDFNWEKQLENYSTLRAIAVLVGYVEEEGK